jgi:hypothetical protein
MDRPYYSNSWRWVIAITLTFLGIVALHTIVKFFYSRSQKTKEPEKFTKKDSSVDLLPHLKDKGDLRMDIEFNKLGLVLNGSKKRVLNSVTGILKSGRITAIMGPSGAGKTVRSNTRATTAPPLNTFRSLADLHERPRRQGELRQDQRLHQDQRQGGHGHELQLAVRLRAAGRHHDEGPDGGGELVVLRTHAPPQDDS